MAQATFSCPFGAIHLLPTSARLVPDWRIFHMTPFGICFLVLPPAACLERAALEYRGGACPRPRAA